MKFYLVVATWLLSVATCAQKTIKMKDTRTSDESEVLAITRQLTQLMIERDTVALSKILDGNFTLTHITGYVQPRSEWFSEIQKESMKYYSAKEVSHSIKVYGRTAEVIQQNLLDARIWGSRNTWRLQQKIQMEKRNGEWIILNSVASVF